MSTRRKRLSMIWIKNFTISCLLLLIVYTSHNIRSVTGRIATAMIATNSNSRSKNWRQSSNAIKNSDFEDGKILASSKIKVWECSNSSRSNNLGVSVESPGSSRKLGEHRGDERVTDGPVDHPLEESEAKDVASLVSKANKSVSLGPDLQTLSDTLGKPETRILDIDHLPKGPMFEFAKDGGQDDTDESSLHSSDECEYKVITVTGKQDGAGTGSDISISLSNADGDHVIFRRLENGHRTFEKGHTDTFLLNGRPCVANVCRMILYTDDYGLFSEWFVVSVTIFVSKLQAPDDSHCYCNRRIG